MADYEFKAPTSQAEYDAMKKTLRAELSDAELDAVVGGNDDKNKHKKIDPPIPYTCPFCGATVMIRQFEDGPKHMTKCPNNPYK